MKLLWRDWPERKIEILSKQKKLLLLDFDGTLAPIAAHPEKVVLPRETPDAIQRLAQSDDYYVVIISGRRIQSLKAYFMIKNIIYVGNHGFELKGKGLQVPEEVRESIRCTKQYNLILARKLRLFFKDIPQVWVENKGATLSLHFRDLDPLLLRSFRAKWEEFLIESRNIPVVWRKGKKVWGARPNVAWGKGDAVLLLLKKFPHALTLVVGDDNTDEDMFKVLNRSGITIRVGFSKNSNAAYFVKSTHDVARLLKEICQ